MQMYCLFFLIVDFLPLKILPATIDAVATREEINGVTLLGRFWIASHTTPGVNLHTLMATTLRMCRFQCKFWVTDSWVENRNCFFFFIL